MNSYGTLYLCATPIGNLEDMTYRAVRVLGEVDAILCEDTRHTVKLLNHYGIKKELISYHEHNQMMRNEEIVTRMLNGESFALCSDAGMPTISDPGTSLVRAAAEKGLSVTILPGACAAVSALSVSGYDIENFTFIGFLEKKGANRKKKLAEIGTLTSTVVLYESPHHLLTTLNDLLAALGDRNVALVRELTKVHEEVRRAPLSQHIAYLTDNPPKGEFVIVLERCLPTAPDTDEDSILAHLKALMDSGLTKKEAVKQTAQDLSVKKNDVYKLAEENL